MMAIFHSIVKKAPAVPLYTQVSLPTRMIASNLVHSLIHTHALQVSTLVSLRLLAQCSKTEDLDCPKYKCVIDLTTAQQLAK